jgi:hypothetical protein
MARSLPARPRCTGIGDQLIERMAIGRPIDLPMMAIGMS